MRPSRAALLRRIAAAVIASLILLSSLWSISIASTHPVETWTNPSYGPWHSATLGGGGYLQNVVLSPSDPLRVYAYGDCCGLFRSDDGGQTWRMLHGSLPTSIGNYEISGVTVDPRNADKIAIETGSQWAPSQEGIYVSNDGGATWAKTLTAAWAGNGPHRMYGFLLARSPANPDVLLAASVGTGVFRSEDGGGTWQDCGVHGYYSSDIRFDAKSPNRAYLCAIGSPRLKLPGVSGPAGGFFRSDDGGKTWTQVSPDSPLEMVQDPQAPSTFYGIFNGTTIERSTDGCATWQPFADGLPASDGKFLSLAAGPNFILTATDLHGSFYRLDEGETRWQPVVRQSWDLSQFRLAYGMAGQATASITVDPRNPDHWYATDYMGMYQTWDAGKTSKYTLKGIETTVVHDVTPDLADPKDVYIGLADIGGFWSDDGGETYHSILISGGGSNIKMISQSPADPNVIYEVGSHGYGDPEATQIFVSTDRGRHYTSVSMQGTGFPKGWIICDSIVADPANAKTAYVTNGRQLGDGGGTYKTVDGGQSWTWMGQGLPAKSWFFQTNLWVHGPEIAASADGCLVALSSKYHSAYRFDPSKAMWEHTSVGGNGSFWTVVADPMMRGRYYVASLDGVYRSDDSGVSWRTVLNQGAKFVAADPRVPGRVAVGTADGVVVSLDAGAHWTMLDKSLPYRRFDRVGFAGNRLIAGTDGSGMFWCELPAALRSPAQ